MRTTVTLDDELMANAATYSGIEDKSKLINLVLNDYIRRMASKRLVALGGTMPDLVVPGRNDSRMEDDVSPSREAARSLAALGGTMPELDSPRRRQSGGAEESQLSRVAEDSPEYKTGDAEA